MEVVNPKIRKRFIDSIEYLREMGFFKRYSRLSSDESLERILERKIDYYYWWEEWDREKKRLRRRGRHPDEEPWG